MAITATPAAIHLVVMGVSGSGKTTMAELLGERLGWPVVEGDDLHPPANVKKMAAGTPLGDADRWPWLEILRGWMERHAEPGRGTVVTCSALRRSYRDVLRRAPGTVRFIHLHGDPSVTAERMTRRIGHYMPPAMLASQLATLEPLAPDEDGIRLVNDAAPDVLVERALTLLGLMPGPA